VVWRLTRKATKSSPESQNLNSWPVNPYQSQEIASSGRFDAFLRIFELMGVDFF
jgi:hypothetical protein